MLSAYLSPFCNVWLVRFKKNRSNEFILLINHTELFSAASRTYTKMNIDQSLSHPEENPMRTLTNDYSDCQVPNLGYTKK